MPPQYDLMSGAMSTPRIQTSETLGHRSRAQELNHSTTGLAPIIFSLSHLLPRSSPPTGVSFSHPIKKEPSYSFPPLPKPFLKRFTHAASTSSSPSYLPHTICCSLASSPKHPTSQMAYYCVVSSWPTSESFSELSNELLPPTLKLSSCIPI